MSLLEGNEPVVSTGEEAPPAVAPPPGNPRFPLFDGLRAIAALSVLVCHVTDAPLGYAHGWVGRIGSQGNVGVTIFFLVSGFLLYRPFVAARRTGRVPPRIRDFARRRILRIVPAYWLALTLATLWLGIHGPFSRDWWIYYGFLQTYHPATAFAGLSVAWSLSTEMTFYVLLPLYAMLAARIAVGRRSFRRETLVLAGFGLIALIFDVVEPHFGSYKYTYTIAGTMDWFALGMFFAAASVEFELGAQLPPVGRILQGIPEISWLLAVAAFLFEVALRTYHPIAIGTHLLYGATAFFLLFPAVFPPPLHGRTGVPRVVLGIRLLSWIGLVSYGVYLWHTPIIEKLEPALIGSSTSLGSLIEVLVVATVAAIAAGAASYYLVEQWFLRLKYRKRDRRSEAPRRGIA